SSQRAARSWPDPLRRSRCRCHAGRSAIHSGSLTNQYCHCEPRRTVRCRGGALYGELVLDLPLHWVHLHQPGWHFLRLRRHTVRGSSIPGRAARLHFERVGCGRHHCFGCTTSPVASLSIGGPDTQVLDRTAVPSLATEGLLASLVEVLHALSVYARRQRFVVLLLVLSDTNGL